VKRKKIFFILSSLRAGGAERVFWLISNHFNKDIYDVKIVILNSKNRFFKGYSSEIEVIDLQTIKASRSFFAILKFLRNERPFAVFTTGGQIDILLAITSFFVHIPILIARSTSIPGERIKFASNKSRLLGRFLNLFSFYQRFNKIVCQTEEMKLAWEINQNVKSTKLQVIPNPVESIEKESLPEIWESEVKLITVGTLSEVKGHTRLLDIVALLPENYSLTIVGAGSLHDKICQKIELLHLGNRVKMAGQISGVLDTVAHHNLFVLTSFVEGFPNVALEALSVGIPVVAFRVSGISELIVDGFNGYVIEQGDLEGFKDRLLFAASRVWEHRLIKEDVYSRYSLAPIVAQYERLLTL